MRFLVTPEFNEKISPLSADGLASISSIVNFITSTDKDSLSQGISSIEVRPLSDEIIIIKHMAYRVYASFGTDEEGEYLLLMDVSLEASQPSSQRGFFATKDPRRNMSFDPNRNMSIDPRRNMSIDPRSNMSIDPNRNMSIDPRRNMSIDPRRNMSIDPNRNMSIDPRRNMSIDPNRNMSIDPRRNRYYGGPYIYNLRLEQTGFLVHANENISLIFDTSAQFTSYIVATSNNNLNIFDLSGAWVGFLVSTDNDVLLHFDTTGQWLGIIV